MNDEKESRWKDRQGDLKIGAVIRDAVIAAILLLIIFASIYRIDTAQGAVYTAWNGEKTPVTDVGWHLQTPLLSSVDIYSVVNNNMYFPSDYLTLEASMTGDQQSGSVGYDIKTTDDKVVDTGAVMSYQITDLIQFGVKNTDPETMLQKDFDAVVFNYLQAQDSVKITTNITEVNAELLQRIKDSGMESQYGITVNTVQLLRPTYTKTALDALAQKQAIQATSEGQLIAAQNQAAAIETVAAAQKEQADMLANVPQNLLDFNAKLTLYSDLKGQPNVIWVVPSNANIVMNQPATAVASK